MNDVPDNRSFLPYGRQLIDEADEQAVLDVLRGDWLTTGPAVEAYETAFAERVGARHAIACTWPRSLSILILVISLSCRA